MAKKYSKAEIERLRANPGTRSKLPSKYLTAKQRSQRETIARNRAPLTEGSSLTYGDALKDAKAAEGLKYGQVTNQLQTRERMVPAWFADYQRTVAAQGAAAKARYEAVQGQLAQRTAASTAADVAQRTALDAQAQSDAQVRGAVAAPSTGAVDASNSRRVMADAFASALGQQGVAEQDYFGARAVVGEAAKIGEALRVAKDLETLAGEKGNFRQSYMSQRRDDEWKRVLEKKAYGLKEAELIADSMPKPKSATEKAAELRNKYFEEHGYYPPTGPPKTPKDKDKKPNGKDKFGNTAVQRREHTNKWNSGLTFMRSAIKSDPTFIKEDPSTLVAYLNEKQGVPHDIATAVVEWSQNKGVLSEKTWRTLRRLGIQVSLSHRADKAGRPTHQYGGGDAAGGYGD